MDDNGIQQRFVQLLTLALQAGASDVHIHPEQAPMYRISGDLKPAKVDHFSAAEIKVLSDRLTPPLLRESAKELLQLDFSAEWQGTSRFRVHRFMVRGSPVLVLRVIPLNIPDFKSLRLPPAVKKIGSMTRGLVLITGATGMGKSTTIASLLDALARSGSRHILSIEDPIEYVIESGNGLVSQREVGRDVSDFVAGLWAALRQDPDVIFISEIRDAETVRVALQAAETGHLVISAIHTLDASSTVEHLVNMFPTQEQLPARLRLAEVLEGVFCQRLLPQKGRKNRVLATEVMLRGPSIQEWIRKPDRSKPLSELIAKSSPEGMQSFDQDLRKLFEANLITQEVAVAASSSPSDFIRNLHLT